MAKSSKEEKPSPCGLQSHSQVRILIQNYILIYQLTVTFIWLCFRFYMHGQEMHQNWSCQKVWASKLAIILPLNILYCKYIMPALKSLKVFDFSLEFNSILIFPLIINLFLNNTIFSSIDGSTDDSGVFIRYTEKP